jgi:hypothetical protein
MEAVKPKLALHASTLCAVRHVRYEAFIEPETDAVRFLGLQRGRHRLRRGTDFRRRSELSGRAERVMFI